ncbi:hypothetical protein AB1388_06550 [Streptomyces hydrogenans]|uniref:hypothetical protein n=1 Tax=Streptomyces hydrogenans TaxID=1873719 RepID=UPI00345C94C9
MSTSPDHLRLSIACPPPDEGVVQVRPIVNGRDLLDEMVPVGVGGSGYVGVQPRYLLGHDEPLQAASAPHEVRLALSGCGVEECCGALYVTVARSGEHVVWAGWRDPARQDLVLPELRFTAGPYEAEVLRAGKDRGGEWRGGVVAELLEAGLRRREDWLRRWDCELEGVWASRTDPARIHVVLWHPRDRADPDLPWLQFGMTLPISAETPSAQAERFEAQLFAGDPRATAEVWGGSHDAERLGYPWPPADPL